MSENDPQNTPNGSDESLQSIHHAEGGSIDRALAGEVHWSINDVLAEAWEKQNGVKLAFWGAMLIYIVVLVVLGYVLEMALGAEGPGAVVSQVVIGLVTYPMAAGIVMMGIRRAADQPINTTMVFDYYGKTLQIFLLNLVMSILVIIGFLLLVLPGIYLAFAYAMAIPLLVEKNMGIWQAMETSRKAITKCWFRYFGLMLLMLVIILVSMIPLGLGLIWTMPTLMLVMGVVYRDLFGVEGAQPHAAIEQSI